MTTDTPRTDAVRWRKGDKQPYKKAIAECEKLERELAASQRAHENTRTICRKKVDELAEQLADLSARGERTP